MAIPAIPMIVPAMTCASVGGGATTTGGPTPLSRSDPVLRFVRSRQRFVHRSAGARPKARQFVGALVAALGRISRLVALPPVRDLLLCANLLFVAASDRAGEANGAWAASKGAAVTPKPTRPRAAGGRLGPSRDRLKAKTF
jgi:hypothetical protein